MSQPLFLFSLEVKFLLLFFNDRAINWACACKKMVFSLYGSFNIYIFSVCVKLGSWCLISKNWVKTEKQYGNEVEHSCTSTTS